MTQSVAARPLSVRVWIILLLITSVFSYVLGSRSAGNGGVFVDPNTSTPDKIIGLGEDAPKGKAKEIDFQQFWELWELLQTKFYKPSVDEKSMFYGAMSGLAASLGDPYTVFFEPRFAAEFSRSLEGKFDGIGAEIGIKEGQLRIVAPLSDSPAEKAGLLPGDAILLINGTSTEGMTVERGVSLIRGKKGTRVDLTIGRLKTGKEPTTFEVSIERDTIVVKSVRVKYMDGGLALVEINHFNSDTTDEFSKAAAQIVSRDVKGIILDLRNNPGGYLDRSTFVAGEWLGDQIVVVERRRGTVVNEFKGTGRGRLKGIPTAVLVNEGSASAAEIVAGALQDYGVAKLVGEKTFGKGSVQDFVELNEGMAVKITVAEWLTPKGRSINEIGIEPDILIQRTEDDYNADRDPQLQKAVELLIGSGATAAAQE